MSDKAAETRQLILREAESQFRLLGYGKTTVADIAKACGMSPGNVYRFFTSKDDIVRTIANIWLGEVEDHAAEIAARPIPAADRLVQYIVEICAHTRDRYTEQAKVHELCAMVIHEHWDVVEEHIERMRGHLANILEDGREAGQFGFEDLEVTAKLVKGASVRFFHPMLVAECESNHGDSHLLAEADAHGRFMVHALRP